MKGGPKSSLRPFLHQALQLITLLPLLELILNFLPWLEKLMGSKSFAKPNEY